MTSDNRNSIPSVLTAAGFTWGERPSPGGRAMDSAKGTAGFVMDSGVCHVGMNLVRWKIVDHQGPGRDAALAGYKAALTAAGYRCEVAPKTAHVKKLVLHVERPTA